MSGPQRIGDIEFARGVGHLGIADKTTVHPDVEAGVHPFEIQIMPVVRRRLRQFKGAAVNAAGIVVGNIRRIAGKRIAGVGILRPIVALRLPDRRHRNGPAGTPRRVRLPERLFHVVNAGVIAEIPVPVQQLKTAGSGAGVVRARFFSAGTGYIVGARRHGAYVQALGIFKILLDDHNSPLQSSKGFFFIILARGGSANDRTCSEYAQIDTIALYRTSRRRYTD